MFDQLANSMSSTSCLAELCPVVRGIADLWTRQISPVRMSLLSQSARIFWEACVKSVSDPTHLLKTLNKGKWARLRAVSC